MKILNSCFVLLLLASPAYAFSKKAPAPAPSPSTAPTSIHVVVDPKDVDMPPVGPSDVPDPEFPEVSIGKITGATDKEVTMIHEGVTLLNAKLRGACIKQWVLAARYTENNGLDQPSIWNMVVRHRGTIDVEMYTGSWKANHIYKTVGYENDPFDGVVHMNRYFVKTAFMVADNLIHEDRGHSVGFHHYGAHSTSQPYGMNYAFEGCSQQQMQVRGAKAYRPPGIRLEIRHAKGSTRKKVPAKVRRKSESERQLHE